MGWTSGGGGAVGEPGTGTGGSEGPGDGKEEVDVRSRPGAYSLTQEGLGKAALSELQPCGCGLL